MSNEQQQATNVTLGKAQNVKAKIMGSKLMIEVDLTKNFGRKTDPKTGNLGATENVATVGKPQVIPGTNIYIGLNCYKYPEQ